MRTMNFRRETTGCRRVSNRVALKLPIGIFSSSAVGKMARMERGGLSPEVKVFPPGLVLAVAARQSVKDGPGQQIAGPKCPGKAGYLFSRHFIRPDAES
jgi:hypothetical protein